MNDEEGKFEKLCERIGSALDELETNAFMWFRGRSASIRLLGSDKEYEAAVHHAVRFLLEHQILVLHKFWESKSGDGKKASMPRLAELYRRRSTELPLYIAAKHVFQTPAERSDFIQKKRRQLSSLIELIQKSQVRFEALIGKIKIARNNVLAHNLINTVRVDLDVFDLHAFDKRTARLARAVALAFDGPSRRTDLGLTKRRRLAINNFWLRIEAERSNWFLNSS